MNVWFGEETLCGCCFAPAEIGLTLEDRFFLATLNCTQCGTKYTEVVDPKEGTQS